MLPQRVTATYTVEGLPHEVREARLNHLFNEILGLLDQEAKDNGEKSAVLNAQSAASAAHMWSLAALRRPEDG